MVGRLVHHWAATWVDRSEFAMAASLVDQKGLTWETYLVVQRVDLMAALMALHLAAMLVDCWADRMD